MEEHIVSSRTVSGTSFSSAKSSEADTRLSDDSSEFGSALTTSTSYSDHEDKIEHPLSPTFILLRELRIQGVNCITILTELQQKRAITTLTTSIYPLGEGISCCATLSVDGRETGVVRSTAFGYQFRATKQKAAELLVEKLEWFLAPTTYIIPTRCFEKSPTTTCLEQGLPPPASEFVFSTNQAKVMQECKSHWQRMRESREKSDLMSYVSIDIEAYDKPNSAESGWVKEIGISWLPAGDRDLTTLRTRHMIVEGRQHLHNVHGLDATDQFAFGQSEVLPLATITEKIEELFQELGRENTPVCLVGWNFINDDKWLKDRHQFNVNLSRWNVRLVDVSKVWQAIHQSPNGRKLGNVMREESVACEVMHNAGNDAHGTMQLFWKISL